MQLPTSPVVIPQATPAYDRLILTLTNLTENRRDELVGCIIAITKLKKSLEDSNHDANWEHGLAKLEECFTKLSVLAPFRKARLFPREAIFKYRDIATSLLEALYTKSPRELQDMFNVDDDKSTISDLVRKFEYNNAQLEECVADLLEDDVPPTPSLNDNPVEAFGTTLVKHTVPGFENCEIHAPEGANIGVGNEGNVRNSAKNSKIRCQTAFSGNKVVSGRTNATHNSRSYSSYSANTTYNPRMVPSYHGYEPPSPGPVVINGRAYPSGGRGLQPLNAQQEREIAQGLVKVTPRGIQVSMNGVNVDKSSSNGSIGSNYTFIG